ncbi:MAG: hypothetical protein ABII82_18845 [Verrucomicrobiota bacterium]
MDPRHLLFALIIASLVVVQLNLRLASPVLAILNRWLRAGVISLGLAALFQDLAWSDRPYAVLAIIFALLWILAETIYNWLAINALSLSPLPLFPKFTINRGGDEWPTNPRLLKTRDWLRAEGFKQVQSLKAEIGPSHHLRVSVYQDAEAKIRLQVTFLPQANGAVSLCASLGSHTAAGRRYVTDNLYLPFGGFYPENWHVLRNPWFRSLPRLLKRHRDRLARSGEIVLPWTTEPLADLNEQQQDLERINTELGFLQPRALREEHGKITHEGRYRVWKEIFTLGYLGRSARYE